jgi:beta-glucanase (GH16 family)
MPVREAQERFEGWLPQFGTFQLRARAVVSPRSMVAWWMVGFEDEPDRSGEICVAEIFGDAVEPGSSAAIGMGLHAFRDPRTAEDFEAVRIAIDVAAFHTYAVDWTADHVEFFVDGTAVRRCRRPPAYPMQMMLAAFDFPDRSVGDDDHLVPELVIDWLRGDAR